MRLLFITPLLLIMLNGRAQDTPTLSPFTKVEIEGGFPGGTQAWMQFLNKNLHYPDQAIDKNIQGDVVVQFEIDKEGNIGNIKVLSGPKKGGLREEAIRVIKISGKWLPAVENSVLVKSYKRETISFKLSVS
jgi:periplasmic protein TonB